MIKWVLVVLAALGFLVVAGHFAPSLFSNGFQAAGHFIPWVSFGVVAVIYFGYKLKGK